MNILTDILSLFKRKQIIETPSPEDLIVLGRHEQPDMLGIASPIPYKSVKLVKVKDLIESPATCTYQNLVNNGGTNPAGIYKSTTTNPCVIGLRSLAAVGNNIDVTLNANEIEISTTGEPNLAQSTGSGIPVYTDKVGETLRFRSISAADNTIQVNTNHAGTEVRISLKRVILRSPNGGIWEVTVDDSGQLTTSLVG